MLSYRMGFLLVVLLLCPSLVMSNSVNHRRILSLRHATMDMDVRSAGVETSYTQSWVDHDSRQTLYHQRYYVNRSYYKPGGPLLIYIGGEAPLSPNVIAAGEIVETAKTHNGLLVALEHRYYGESQPESSWDTASLQYLTIEQALSDLQDFQHFFYEENNLGLYKTKVICFGGSYPGSLSAFYHYSRPELTVAALASSAPVWARNDFYEYDQSIAASVGSKTAQAIRLSTSAVTTRLYDNMSRVMDDFALGSLQQPTVQSILYVLADIIAFGVQYGQLAMVQSSFTSASASSSTLTPYEQYVAYAQVIRQQVGDLAEFDITAFRSTAVSFTDNMRQWMYQSCTQVGWFQVAPTHDSLRSPLINLEWHAKVCAELFGLQHLAETDAVNLRYGAKSMDRRTTQTIFVNGEEDPWKTMAITPQCRADVHSCEQQVDDNRLVLIADAAHCADLHASSPKDSPNLIRAREWIATLLSQWLSA